MDSKFNPIKKTLRQMIFLILISLVFISCRDIADLDGTWIMAYFPDEKLDSSLTLFGYEDTFNTWTFEDGSLYKRGFYSWNGQRQSFEVELNGNRLVYLEYEDQFSNTTIDQLADDRILIKTSHMGSSQETVYIKLADSLKNTSEKFKLTGNTFIRTFKRSIDTIQFVNDSIYISDSWNKGRPFRWERVSINGFDILFSELYPPFVLKKKEGSKIHVSTFDRNKEDYILEEIKYDKVLKYNY